MKSSRMLVFFSLSVLAVFTAISLACALPDAAAQDAASNFPLLPVSLIVITEAFLLVAIKLTIGKRVN
jgi:hypothetical protein